MRNILLFCGTFIFVFGWKISQYNDIILDSSIALIFFAFIVFQAPLNKYVLFVAGVLATLSVYAVTIVLLNGAVDIQIALRSIRATLNFLGGAGLVYFYWRSYREQFQAYVILHLYLALVIHAVLIIIMFLNADIRAQVYSITSTYDYVNLFGPILQGARISGLTYGLAQTSVLQLFGLLLVPALFAFWGTNIYRRVLIVFGIIALMISVFLAGRSGLLFAVVLLPALLWFIQARGGLFWNGMSYRRLSSVIAFTGLLIALLGGSYFLAPAKISYNIIQAGELKRIIVNKEQTKSIQLLSDMYFLPKNDWVLLFGSSNLGRGKLPYIPSDIGWVLSIYAIGVIGAFLMALPYIFGAWQVLRIRGIDRYISISTFFILLGTFLLHFKAMSLLTRNQWSVQAMLLCTCFLLRSMRKKDRVAVQPISRLD